MSAPTVRPEADRVGPLMRGHGERAASAASGHERTGRAGLRVVVGGPDDWAEASGRVLEVGA